MIGGLKSLSLRFIDKGLMFNIPCTVIYKKGCNESSIVMFLIQSTPDFGTLYFGEIRFWRHISVAPISSMGLQC